LSSFSLIDTPPTISAYVVRTPQDRAIVEQLRDVYSTPPHQRNPNVAEELRTALTLLRVNLPIYGEADSQRCQALPPLFPKWVGDERVIDVSGRHDAWFSPDEGARIPKQDIDAQFI
jgi:hypothetical protein